MTLVDVGVWLAAVWGKHQHHEVAATWIDEHPGNLLFCRVTQTGLLRLLSNPSVMGSDVVTRSGAWRVFDQLLEDERISWVDEPMELEGVFRAVSAREDNSHKLWTDDYLAAFAQTASVELATLDRKLAARYPSVQVVTLGTGAH
ncbi:TA system VapC family ribonuclease toxin [Nocardia vermiculata]|uniref:Ribonuclease VapC n=1 Tax=Nocardia vermiculata TaxID=257274 RepID=A0A846Y170_9NOCA|nr:TA system VapC family ribonuclease toxin [Nocardia vermiculata]NKY50309.1 VapC toxin family PIN domain ribonuclease [Nocardia vermiculata]